jgi:protocatechuate 3,4-dioxygenase beta subunit
MKLIPLLLLALIPAFASVAVAQPETEDKYITNCLHTVKIKPDEKLPKPADIVPSGKLALPAGKSMFAAGQPVFLSGKVLDGHCMPVANAVIEIWQADATGKYIKDNLGDRLSPYPAFSSTGRAVTDNLGRYQFVTIFPGIGREAAPHLHVRITHENFRPFVTEMYFADDARNMDEKRFSKLSDEDRKSVTARVWPRDKNNPDKGLYARWDIGVWGVVHYKHY